MEPKQPKQPETHKPHPWPSDPPPYKDKNWYSLPAWIKYTFRFKHRNPKCYVCGVFPTQQVDHFIPHKGDWDHFKDHSNHVPMCLFCHGRVTYYFDKDATPENKLERAAEKSEWIKKMRKRYKNNNKVVRVPV